MAEFLTERWPSGPLPERIWAMTRVGPTDGIFDTCWAYERLNEGYLGIDNNQTEYVRLDLYEALKAKLAALEPVPVEKVAELHPEWLDGRSLLVLFKSSWWEISTWAVVEACPEFVLRVASLPPPDAGKETT